MTAPRIAACRLTARSSPEARTTRRRRTHIGRDPAAAEEVRSADRLTTGGSTGAAPPSRWPLLETSLYLAEVEMITRRLSLLCASLLVGCGVGSGNWEITDPPPAPPLPQLEAVSYERLGRGKLAFQRANVPGVYLVDAEARTTSSSKVGGRYAITAPHASPDGRRLVFTDWAGETLSDVYVSDFDGSGAQQASDFPGQEGPPSWSPDGRQIVFAVDETVVAGKPTAVIYRQSPVTAPSDRVRVAVFDYPVGDALRCPWIEIHTAGAIAVSAEGRLAFACFNSTIYSLDQDGRNLRAIATAPPATADRLYQVFAPAWSPDGRRFAYLETARNQASPYNFVTVSVRVADGTNSEPQTLATVPANGTASMASGNGTDLSLCWSPVGGWLAFSVPDGEPRAHVYVVDADGSRLERFTTAPDAYDRTVSCSR